MRDNAILSDKVNLIKVGETLTSVLRLKIKQKSNDYMDMDGDPIRPICSHVRVCIEEEIVKFIISAIVENDKAL